MTITFGKIINRNKRIKNLNSSKIINTLYLEELFRLNKYKYGFVEPLIDSNENNTWFEFGLENIKDILLYYSLRTYEAKSKYLKFLLDEYEEDLIDEICEIMDHFIDYLYTDISKFYKNNNEFKLEFDKYNVNLKNEFKSVVTVLSDEKLCSFLKDIEPLYFEIL